MVGFHVVHHQIVEFAAIQHGGHILEKLCSHSCVGSVQKHGFLVQQDIAVIRNATGDGVNVFEQSELSVACTYIVEVLVYLT